MKVQVALHELDLRLNKLGSSDYDNIPVWLKIQALNKFQIEWVRRQVHGTNRTQESDEETKVKTDDLQKLLVPDYVLKGKNHEGHFDSDVFPENYLFYKRIIPKASSDCCKKVPMYSLFVEEANIPKFLTDWSYQPSFEWRQTLHTLMSNRLRIYKEKDFLIDEVDFVYYRKPQRIDIAGYTHVDGTPSITSNIEFKEDIANIIVDGAASILAGDTESPNATQITGQRTEINT